MATFQQAIITLDAAGLTDVILPFLLVFVLVFAIMQKTKVLTEQRKINSLIALVIGLSVVIPHVLSPSPNDVVNIFKQALPNVSAFFVGILALFMLVGMWGVKPKWGDSAGWIVIVSLVIVGFLFMKAGGIFDSNFPPWLNWLDDSTTQTLIVFIIVFVAIVYFITSEPNKGKPLGERVKPLGQLFEKS